jgi:serine/threonine protein kinase
MALAPGARLGTYEILAFIGAGGMGEVWRARDTRLSRDVALKILPESLARDPDSLARLEREARRRAARNQTNKGASKGHRERAHNHQKDESGTRPQRNPRGAKHPQNPR